MENNGIWGLIIVAIAFTVLITACFLAIMFANLPKKKHFKKNENDVPAFVFRRYRAYCMSFIAWTIVQYLLMLIPLFTSTATVYFTAEFLKGSEKESAVLMAIMSFLSALLPLMSSRVQPKAHADGFYHAFTKTEQAILKYEHKLINMEELIKTAAEAETDSNPFANNENEKKQIANVVIDRDQGSKQ